ncbi:MAG: SDR family oxidoreductase [Actinobacteria bacterium]|nr:SDR family oxidoreductase [Actinomycetota bacterium]
MSQPSLEGRCALVTGVSRRIGIGAAIARRLADLGADLFLCGWSAHDAAQPWRADPDGIEAMEADFLDPAAPAEVMAAAVASLGHVDVLVANHARSDHLGLLETNAEELDAQWAVNTRATLLLVQAFAAQHDGRTGGRVVMMTSGQHRGPMPGELGYVATKGAIHQVTRTLAAELLARGITVNTVNPGATDTGWATPEQRERVPAWGHPDDAARLIAWLCTDDACWINGQVIDSTGAPF